MACGMGTGMALPSLRSLSLPGVPAPLRETFPSPGSPCLSGVPFPQWHPRCLRGPCPFWAPHPSWVSLSLLGVPIPPGCPCPSPMSPSPGSPHLGEQQERAAGARVGVLLPQAKEFGGEHSGGEEAEEEEAADGEVAHLLPGQGDRAQGSATSWHFVPPPPAPPWPPPRAAPRGTAPPPTCGAA